MSLRICLRRVLLLGLMILAAFTSGAVGRAGSISFSNQSLDLSGTGFGNTLRVLAVHANGSEYGSVSWNGATDVRTADATNQSQTQTVQSLASAGVTASLFKLVFNIAEPGSGPTVKLFDFSLQFVNSAGSALFPDLVYTAPVGGLELTQVAAGIGGAGWMFHINLTPAEATAFFGSPTNRLGMSIASGSAIQQSGGAAEVFFVAPVPEPSSLGLTLIAGLAMAVWGYRRRA